MDLSKTGKRIWELRTKPERKWSQALLAEKIGIGDKRTISDWENGKNIPKLENIEKLAKAFDCDPEYLLGTIDKPTITVSWISEQIPLSENNINLLIELKKERDRDCSYGSTNISNRTILTTNFADLMLELILSDKGYAGEHTMIIELMEDLIKSLRIVNEYDSKFDFPKTIHWKYLPPDLRDNEHFRAARYQADRAADNIADIFKDIVVGFAEVSAEVLNELMEEYNGKEE